MSKVLITADLHLGDYRNHNLFDDPQFRLNQFRKLSERFLDILENYNVKTIIIAGDFFHVAAPRPVVVNRGIDFLETLTKKAEIYLIRGNHDTDARRGEITKESTLLSVCDRLNHVFYRHREYATIGGKRFYFLGWTPNTEEEIDHLTAIGGTDVFIGHFQPGTVKIGQRGFLLEGGRVIPDVPPWKIGFVGDVHTHQIAPGNIVIPGVPIQHSFNDPEDTGVILFDTKTFEWTRIETQVPGKWDFLHFRITDEPSQQDKWVILRPETYTESSRMQRTFEKKLDVLAVINEQIAHHHLAEVHSDIFHSVSKEEVRQEVDLNFLIERILIHDFRSIKHFEWNGLGEGIKLLFGNNGTGKSSLVSALMFALSGEGSARTLTRRGSNNMYVEVTLLYGRLKHTLRRGWSTSGKIRYWINDVEQQAENQRALLEKIEDNLPFLRFVDLIHHQQDRPGFLSSYNYSARVDLISRVLGLRIVQALYEEAQRRLLDLDRQLATLRAKIATVNAIVEQETLVDFTYREIIDDGKENNLKTLRNSIRSLVREERRKHNEISTQKTTLIGCIERTTYDVASLKDRIDRLRRKSCFTCGQTIDDEKYEVLFSGISTEISTKTAALADYHERLNRLDVPSTELVERLEARLEQTLGRLSEISLTREHCEKLTQLKTRIEGAKTELLNFRNEHSLLIKKQEKCQDYKALLDSTGPIMRTLLLLISDTLSSDILRVKAHKQLVSGEIRPDFGVELSVAGLWVSYDDASGGQKTVADIMILEKLLHIAGGLGLLIFDETFKFLDGENLEKIVEVIKRMPCSNIFIVSHVDSFPMWDSSISTRLDENNMTKYTIH